MLKLLPMSAGELSFAEVAPVPERGCEDPPRDPVFEMRRAAVKRLAAFDGCAEEDYEHLDAQQILSATITMFKVSTRVGSKTVEELYGRMDAEKADAATLNELLQSQESQKPPQQTQGRPPRKLPMREG